MLALDALFCYTLWRSTGRRHDSAIDFWLIFALLIGPLSYLRFDMLPAVPPAARSSRHGAGHGSLEP